MDKRSYTVITSTGPLRALNDELLESVAAALATAASGVEKADIVDFAVVQDLPGDEFASARDDIVGTPDVAARPRIGTISRGSMPYSAAGSA